LDAVRRLRFSSSGDTPARKLGAEIAAPDRQPIIVRSMQNFGPLRTKLLRMRISSMNLNKNS
jgi:hypothetical protein